MVFLKRIAVFALLVFSVCSWGCSRPAQPSMTAPSEKPVLTLERAAYDILAASQRVGSIVYRRSCSQAGVDTSPYPIERLTSYVPMDAALNQISHAHRNLTWRESGGIVRITDASANQLFLNAPMKDVRINRVQGPNDALVLIWKDPELRVFMAQHQIEFAPSLGGLGSFPGAHAPVTIHLRNVTVGQTLDRIATTFRAVWVYSECEVNGQTIAAVSVDELPGPSIRK